MSCTSAMKISLHRMTFNIEYHKCRTNRLTRWQKPATSYLNRYHCLLCIPIHLILVISNRYLIKNFHVKDLNRIYESQHIGYRGHILINALTRSNLPLIHRLWKFHRFSWAIGLNSPKLASFRLWKSDTRYPVSFAARQFILQQWSESPRCIGPGGNGILGEKIGWPANQSVFIVIMWL